MEAPPLLSSFLFSTYFIYGVTFLIIKFSINSINFIYGVTFLIINFSISIYFIYGVTFLIINFSIFNLFYLWSYLPNRQVFYILSILSMELPSLLLSFQYSFYFIHEVTFHILKFSILCLFYLWSDSPVNKWILSILLYSG